MTASIPFSTRYDDAISNSLRLLRRMFNLARDTGKLTNVPRFSLPPGKSRSGFLPSEVFQKLCDAMPSRLQPMLRLLYTTSVRVGEAERIEWSAADLDSAKVTLLGGETKNGQSCVLPLVPEPVKLLMALPSRDSRVFPTKRTMPAAFSKACTEAGIEGLLIHDLRRSGALPSLRKAAP